MDMMTVCRIVVVEFVIFVTAAPGFDPSAGDEFAGLNDVVRMPVTPAALSQLYSGRPHKRRCTS
jgi:hypothetical protein